MSSLTFLVADDHRVLRIGLSHLLQETFSDCRVIESRSCQETLSIVSSEDVNLLILDIDFPDGNSLTIVDDIKEVKHDLKIILFSSYDRDFLIDSYKYLPVNGYIQKSSSEEQVINAINAVLDGGEYFDGGLDDTLGRKESKGIKMQNPQKILSSREFEVAALMVEGLGNLEICNKLNLNKTTVSTYKKRIFEKLELESIASLIELFNFYKLSN